MEPTRQRLQERSTLIEQGVLPVITATSR